MAVIDDAQQITGGNTNGGGLSPSSVDAARSFFQQPGTPELIASAITGQSQFKAASVEAASTEKLQAMEGTPAPTSQPTPPKPLSEAQSNFVSTHRDNAVGAASELGVQPETILAVMAQESGWSGKAKDNNFFNIKGSGGRTVDALEYDAEGNAYYEPSTFRGYESSAESMADYVNFLKDNPRYSTALEVAATGDDEGFLREIQKAGYATDPNYAENIINIRNRLGGTSTPEDTTSNQVVQDYFAQQKATEEASALAGTTDSSNFSAIQALSQPDNVEAVPIKEAAAQARDFLTSIDLGEGGLKQSIDIAGAFADRGLQAVTGIVAAVPRRINELRRDNEAVAAIQRSDAIDAELEALAGGDPIQAAILRNEKKSLNAILDEPMETVYGSEFQAAQSSATKPITRGDDAREYVTIQTNLDAMTEASKTLEGLRDKSDYNKIVTDTEGLVDRFADDYAENGTSLKGVVTAASDFIDIMVENPKGSSEFLAEQLPNVFLGVVGNVLSVSDSAYNEALATFKKEYGVEPTAEQRNVMQALTVVAGGVGAFGDEAVKGALKPLLSKASAILPDTLLGKLFGGVVGTPTRLVSQAGLEGVSEGTENILTQAAGKQDASKISLREAATEGLLGVGAGGVTTTGIEVATNPIVQGTVKYTAKAAVGTAQATGFVAKKTLQGLNAINNIPKTIKARKEAQEAQATRESIAARQAERDGTSPVGEVTPEQAAAEADIPTADIIADPATAETPSVEEVSNTANDVESAASVAEAANPISQGAKNLVNVVKQASSAFTAHANRANLEATDTVQLLSDAANVGKNVDSVVSFAQQLLATDLPESDRVIVQDIANRINANTKYTVAGSIAALVESNPTVKTNLTKATEAMLSTDAVTYNTILDQIDESLGSVSEEAYTETRQGLINSMLQNALFSTDVGNNPNLSVANLRRGAELSTGVISEQYTAAADLKDVNQVADDVISGSNDSEFVGVNTHIANLKGAIDRNDKAAIAGTIGQLAQFHTQRKKKADAIRKAITKAEKSGVTEDARYSKGTGGGGAKNRGVFQVHPNAIAAAVDIANIVENEGDFVAYGMVAANTLRGKRSGEALVEAAKRYRDNRAEAAPETATPTTEEAVTEPTAEPSVTTAEEEVTPTEEVTATPEEIFNREAQAVVFARRNVRKEDRSLMNYALQEYKKGKSLDEVFTGMQTTQARKDGLRKYISDIVTFQQGIIAGREVAPTEVVDAIKSGDIATLVQWLETVYPTGVEARVLAAIKEEVTGYTSTYYDSPTELYANASEPLIKAWEDGGASALQTPNNITFLGDGFHELGFTPELLLHELDHAVLTTKINEQVALPADQRSQDFNNLEALYNDVQSRITDKNQYPVSNIFTRKGLAYNLNEFVTYGRTNPQMKGILENIKYPENKNAFTRLIDLGLRLLGVTPTVGNVNAYTALLGAVEPFYSLPIDFQTEVTGVTADGEITTGIAPPTQVFSVPDPREAKLLESEANLTGTGMAATVQTFDDAKLENETEAQYERRTSNRFRRETSKIATSPIWADTLALDTVSELEPTATLAELQAVMEEAGVKADTFNEADLAMARQLNMKRIWFANNMAKIASDITGKHDNIKGGFTQLNVLRSLLDNEGNFPSRVVDAAFMAYFNTANRIGDSFYTDDLAITSMLNLNDTSELINYTNVDKARSLGTPVSPKAMGTAFKRAMGLKLRSTEPESIADSVYSAMGSSLASVFSADPEFHMNTITEADLDPSSNSKKIYRGYTLRTADSDAAQLERTGTRNRKEPPRFFFFKKLANGAISKLTDPAYTAPENYINEVPPEVTEATVNGGANLTAAQVQAENISRKTPWVADTLISSFSKVLGLDGFKALNGYVNKADRDLLNINDAVRIDGQNMLLVSQYTKMNDLLDKMNPEDRVYFASEYSSVRRQQMQGDVNVLLDKYQRSVMGLAEAPTVGSINLNNVTGRGTKGDGYYFMLALGQALGEGVVEATGDRTSIDADKQSNVTTFKATAARVQEELNATEPTLVSKLASYLDDNGEFRPNEPLSASLIAEFNAEAGGNFHKQQGLLTLAKLIKSSDGSGKVSNFKHYLRYEVDGLTNGPFHATFLSGLGSMTSDQAEEYMQRGGFMTSQNDKETHKQIEAGDFIDTYNNAADLGNTFLEVTIGNLKETAKSGDSKAMRNRATALLAAIEFTAKKGAKAKIVSVDQTEGTITILRAGAKNPVTVSVYGGGATGIHKTIARELASVFYQEMSESASSLTPKNFKTVKTALLANLVGWESATYTKGNKFWHIDNVRNANNAAELRQVLVKMTLNSNEFLGLTESVTNGIGGAITDSIDEIYAANKHTAALMNSSLNLVTVLANNTFTRMYKALHAKRVVEGLINEYDSLSRKDTNALTDELKKSRPFIKTAVQGSSTDIAESNRTAVAADAGVKAPSLTSTGKNLPEVAVNHTTTGFAAPGVRGIPILTISVDANSQIVNRILQGKNDKYLNVFDAIDYTADSTLPAANELFNTAEYISLVSSDPLATVEDAVKRSLLAQSKPITVEGITIDPVFSTAQLEDAGVSPEQEDLRAALNELSLPVHKNLPSFADTGDIQKMLTYLLQQLSIERNNAEVGRKKFIFGNDTLLMNQMAGIDGGGAKIVAGQVQLSSKAKALMSAAGVARVDFFNRRMAEDKREWDARPPEGREFKYSTDMEALRASSNEYEAKLELREVFKANTGILGSLRAVGSYSSDTVSYTFNTASSRAKFKELLFGLDIERKPDADSTDAFNTKSYLPNNGILFDTTTNTSGIDSTLKNLTIEVTGDIPVGKDGVMTVADDGSMVIKLRQGLSQKNSERVLQHEMTHAIVHNGISEGVADVMSGTETFAGTMVKEQRAQIGRYLKWAKKNDPDNPNTAVLQHYLDVFNADKTAANLYTLMQEHMALVAADGLQAEFGKSTLLKADIKNAGFRDYVTKSLKSAVNYIKKIAGKFNIKSTKYISEADIFANLMSGYATVKPTVATADIRGGTIQQASPLFSTSADEARALLRAGENRVDNAIRSKTSQGIAGFFRALSKSDPSVSQFMGQYMDATGTARDRAFTNMKNDFLTGAHDGKKMQFFREFFAEFMSRDRTSSKVIDALSNRKTTTVETSREDNKVVVSEAMDKAFGGLTEEQSAIVTKGIMRTDLGVLLRNGASLNDIASYATKPSVRKAAINMQIDLIQNNLGLSKAQSNLMLNEARALGMRSVTGGAYTGLNLPNARTIANLYGTDIVGSTDSRVELAIDELASLYAIDTLDTDTQLGLAKLAIDQSLINPRSNGFTYVTNKQESIVLKQVERHGTGVLNTIPKGYVPSMADAGKALKVIPASEIGNYKGWTKVRNFKLDAADKGVKMIVIHNDQGAIPNYVQGAMSTIETSVGGFVSGTGRATDTSLPYITTGKKQRGIADSKRALAKQLSKGLVQLKQVDQGLLPNVNSLGKVIGYRYSIPFAEQSELVGQETDAGTILGSYDSRVVEEGFAEEFNADLATTLGEAYNSRTEHETEGEFVKVSSNSSDPQVAEIWNVMPNHLKRAFRDEFGGNFAYVHKRDLNNAFGYREWSISQLWNPTSTVPKREMFIAGLEILFGADAPAKLRWAEKMLQAGVGDLKDLIVVKSGVVPAANLMSNLNQLHLRGIAIPDIIKDGKEGGLALHKYRAENGELIRLLEDIETGDPLERRVKTLRVRELRESIAANPVITLIKAGLLPSVVEDFNRQRDEGVVSKVTALFPKKGENALVDIGKEVLITSDSTLYKTLNSSLEYGDFVAKYVLYQHILRDGGTQEQALDRAAVEFINYNSLSPRVLDYLNKTGAVSFFKYFTRIQPIIANVIKENPTRALMTFIGADTVGLPSIFDALWLTKDIGYTTGLYDLAGMAGGAHPILGEVL